MRSLRRFASKFAILPFGRTLGRPHGEGHGCSESKACDIRRMPMLDIEFYYLLEVLTREVLIKSSLMRLQWKMGEFKAKLASHGTAMAQIFNAEIAHFTCRITNHGLISTSLGDSVD